MIDLKEIAKELNLTTTKELRDNFSSYDGYIELTIPIGNIHMISKEIFEAKTFDEAFECANKYNEKRRFDFEDWRVPTLDELALIYQISETFPHLFANHTTFWSSTTESKTHAWVIDFLFCCGEKTQNKLNPNNVILIR